MTQLKQWTRYSENYIRSQIEASEHRQAFLRLDHADQVMIVRLVQRLVERTRAGTLGSVEFLAKLGIWLARQPMPKTAEDVDAEYVKRVH